MLTLFYLAKAVLLYTEERTVFLFVPLISVILYCSGAFHKGGSTEELCMPFMTYSFFLGLRQEKMGRNISLKEYVFSGIGIAFIFWSKYTISGFYIG